MIRLHLIPETPDDGPPWSCAEVRLLRPYRHAALAGRFEVTQGRRLPPGRIHVVAMQRSGPAGATQAEIEELLRAIRSRGARLVYDIDDDLLSTHPVAGVERYLATQRPRIRFLLREADLVVASTAALAARLAPFNARRVVWRNALDDALVPRTTPAEGGRRIGYFGTLSHLPDLMAIVASLERAIPSSRGAAIELCGIAEDPRLRLLFAGRMATTLRPVQGDYARFHRMLATEAAWAAGLAPLRDGHFNRAKSDIKALDYAAAGIAPVVADHAVYADWPDGETALRAAPERFGEAAARLLDDEALRIGIARRARAYLLERRVLSVAAPALGAAVDEMLG
jgi:glycosyltransferase involved in cell wall biosynthesis